MIPTRRGRDRKIVVICYALSQLRTGMPEDEEGLLFSLHFEIGKGQLELDFVDAFVDADIPLFIDPYALARRRESWAERAHGTLITFFTQVVESIREDDMERARQLMGHLREPNETHFGYSKGRPQGAGVGAFQAEQLLRALAESTAVRTGFLTSLEETELMVEGISRDKISDLTTNIIRRHLAEYTRDQCELHGVPTSLVPLAPYYNAEQRTWISDYFELPIVHGLPMLLVPKVIARYDPAYDSQTYYSQFVLTYLQAEHLRANSSLVRTFKSGRRAVFKKDLKAQFPGTKENLFQFSRNNPEVLAAYREELQRIEESKDSEVDEEDEKLLAKMLREALESIAAGSEAASHYHRLMIGIVEFLLFPHLIIPRMEQEIHQGRKRIDILMENGAREGIFLRLHQNRGLPCAFVAIECKNYRSDVANPELDQLAGRFSPNRGRIGLLMCRSFDNRELFVKRCRDTFRDDRGLIVPIDDQLVIRWLDHVAAGGRSRVDHELGGAVDEVWVS